MEESIKLAVKQVFSTPNNNSVFNQKYFSINACFIRTLNDNF